MKTLNYPSDKTSKDTQIEDHKNLSLENIRTFNTIQGINRSTYF